MEKIWLYAIVGGFVPIIFWLFFWMREDMNQPEPRRLILKTLIFGSTAAFFAVWIESEVSKIVLKNSYEQVFIFSFIEEFAKLSAVFLAALGSVWNNEREDPMLYMITGALGFAAIENIYYIIDYINNGKYIQSLIDGSYRFIGATLLHIITSATIGIFISWVFFKSKKIRITMAFFGLILATIIHALFNIFIVQEAYEKITFYISWGLIILLLLIFELMDRTEKYRIIKDGIIYVSSKEIDYSKDNSTIDIYVNKNKKITLENENLEILKNNYSDYKNDPFRKKFF